ncbi:MAG TPA: FAD-dependent oxidoreductase [Microthrixaceae bacterium]|nr:FAD-dependent oxidoreductase [Microthrixaceae bacterium]
MIVGPRSLSFWHDTAEDDWTPRPALRGDRRCDVAIVGGGFTGLWTARYLAEADPSLDIVVVEAEICGFGASGRNGGWCSALVASGADDMVEALRHTVDEVGRAALEDGIDCHFAKGGTLILATNAAQEQRLREHAAATGREWLEASAASARLNATGVRGASFTPHCAAIHPARLVRGLARSVERRGVTVAEGTRAIELLPRRVVTDRGTVDADVVLRCTEGYTPSLRHHRRTLVPVYSLMIATEPLSDQVWKSIGLAGRETFTDGRHLVIYGQRTADGRLAFGGRGAPYHFGSAVAPGFDHDPKVFAALEATLRQLLPQVGDAVITHRWGGPLGVPRDWRESVGFDPESGLGWAGGYAGDGVAVANLAGRTLRDLVLRLPSELTELSWAEHRSPRWEPEPIRWIGVNAVHALASGADGSESRGRVAGLRARLLRRMVN